MKRMLFVSLVILFCVSVLFARRLSAKAYVGLYADAGHQILSVNNPGGFFPFQLWIWYLADDDGIMAACHDLVFPSNAIIGTVTQNPALNVALSCPSRCCVTFGECQTGWTWTHHVDCFMTDTNPGVIEVVPLAPDPTVVIATCEPGYPAEQVTVLNHLHLNEPGVIAARPTSWGAIKNLYR